MVIRHSFIDYSKKGENDNNNKNTDKNKNKNYHISIIIISIIIFIALIIVAVVKIRKKIINRRNSIIIENLNNELRDLNQITPTNDNNKEIGTPMSKISNNENINNDNNIINYEKGNNNINYKKTKEDDGKFLNANSSDNSFSNIQRYNSIDSENNNFAPPPIALNDNNNIINNY